MGRKEGRKDKERLPVSRRVTRVLERLQVSQATGAMKTPSAFLAGGTGLYAAQPGRRPDPLFICVFFYPEGLCVLRLDTMDKNDVSIS